MNAEGLVEQMVCRLGAELKGLLREIREGRVPAKTLEGVIRERLWHLGAQAFGVMAEAVDREASKGRAVQDYRTRTVVSLFGPVDLCRARCRGPEGWEYPLDQALGLPGQRGWTVGVQEAVSLLSCQMPFEAVAEAIERFFGWSISAPAVGMLAEAAGERAEAVEAGAPAPVKAPPDTLIVGTDGCQAPQRDGWHEVKMATIYAKQSCVCRGQRGKLLAKEYVASLDNAEGFGRILRGRAEAWGVDGVRRVVVMGDGAGWIWNLSDLHFLGATEIVDFYHAAEHLWETGEALWGSRETSVATKGWVRHYRRKLKEGRVDLVLEGIERSRAERRSSLSQERAKTVGLNLEYFRRNASRMAYGRFRQMGLPIGTGAVEGACKHVVQSRFKRAGMRWSQQGLRHMLALKTAHLNGHWELLWPHLHAA